jgi:hypothetical protein
MNDTASVLLTAAVLFIGCVLIGLIWGKKPEK